MSNTNKLPFSIKKQTFTELLYPVPENTVLTRINTIIYDRRKGFPENIGKSETSIKKAQYVERAEYLEYFETYGYPENVEI